MKPAALRQKGREAVLARAEEQADEDQALPRPKRHLGFDGGKGGGRRRTRSRVGGSGRRREAQMASTVASSRETVKESSQNPTFSAAKTGLNAIACLTPEILRSFESR
jgi:hypothetical protein